MENKNRILVYWNGTKIVSEQNNGDNMTQEMLDNFSKKVENTGSTISAFYNYYYESVDNKTFNLYKVVEKDNGEELDINNSYYDKLKVINL